MLMKQATAFFFFCNLLKVEKKSVRGEPAFPFVVSLLFRSW
jgi:hypothetical protein